MEPEDVRGRLRRRGGGLALAAALQGRDARSTPVPGRAGEGPARQEAGLLRVPAVQGVGQGEGGSGGRGGRGGGVYVTHLFAVGLSYYWLICIVFF